MSLDPKPKQSLIVYEVDRAGGKCSIDIEKGNLMRLHNLKDRRSQWAMRSTLDGIKRRGLCIFMYRGNQPIEMILTYRGKLWAKAWDDQDHDMMSKLVQEWREPQRMVYPA